MSVPIHLLPLSGVFSLAAALLYTATLARTTSTLDGPAKTTADCAPIAYVAVASMLLYYIFLFYQSATAFMEFSKAQRSYGEKKSDGQEKPNLSKIKYGSDNYNVHVMNRTVANYSEQIVPFLVSLFLCATFASVGKASKYGWMWVFFRSYYPVVFQKPFPSLFLSTMPAYVCVWKMLAEVVLAVARM
ncbi:hypothetical protein HJC23_007839 [Cyclotella cryptica]|uniref:MAPEG family protein n=1 Tax=Cyclotella cryptica TaxID=29204 RepID=A0ABD3R082_9STRA|eukprot:CCRYP_000143-RA/>CCRYP_000143-RA protein AED:0.01 eAED:0.01 QI:0/-1/0/1/-1/1/1/0/187